jgi:DnaJ-domain-containing protein 1
MDPLRRAEYLLTLQGHPINEEDTLHAQQELLMDVMEVRQNLEEAEGDERLQMLEQNDGPSFRSRFLFIVNIDN